LPRLGATAKAADGPGVEDERQPIGLADIGPRLYSAREDIRLETDLMRWTPGGLYAWKIVAGLPPRNAHDASASAQGPDRAAVVEGLVLPEGFAAWAVSRKRGLRFPLTEGAAIPMHPGFTDSLDVVAGPAADVEAGLASVPTAVAAFDARIAAAPGSFALHLKLPAASRIRMRVWDLAGRESENAALDLPEGIYHLVRNHGGRGYPTGIYVLSLEWTGGGKSGRLTRKIAIP
jgi:hypothetical protein